MITDEQVREYLLGKYKELSDSENGGYASIQVSIYGYPSTRNVKFSVDAGSGTTETSEAGLSEAISKFVNQDKAKSEAKSLRLTAATLLAKAESIEAKIKHAKP